MKKRYALAAAAALICTHASAQTLKPGLWEITQNMKSSSGEMEKAMAEMQQQMASMPPEQRRMMQEMMAKQGVQMGAGGPGGAPTARMCMTREMAERQQVPMQGDCRMTSQQRSGSTIRMSFKCANPPSSGEMQYTIVSPEAFRSVTTVRATVDGKAETMTMNGAGKWLAADCGAVKPMRPGGK